MRFGAKQTLTAAGAIGVSSGKVVMEVWPVYPDGHPNGVTSVLPL